MPFSLIEIIYPVSKSSRRAVKKGSSKKLYSYDVLTKIINSAILEKE